MIFARAVRQIAWIFTLTSLVLSTPTASSARPAAIAGSPAPVTATPALTAADISAWLDGMIPYGLRTGGIPGAVVVIVKDGRILVSKGYGLADLASGRPMSPSVTLIRPGSVTKLFTWTAVMQQVELGKLDLDADVNRYLDFRIPPYRGTPITLRAIMTHTTGFEEVSKNLISADQRHSQSLDEAVRQWVPKRIYAPGTISGYSNYAAALAGYIVQRVSGERYDAYVARHILQPLGMAHSTFAQPLPPALRSQLASSYGDLTASPQPFEMIAMSPAGAMSATAEDMAQFMIAHLQDGRLGDRHIMSPATARMMQRTITRLIPPLNGIALGFYEQNLNGHEIIAHSGDTVAFHSQLSLFINDGIGIFIAMNGTGAPGAASGLRQAVLADFADRYFPQPFQIPLKAPARAVADAKLVAGLYQSSRRSESTFASIGNLFGGLTVAALPNGDLSLLRRHYREIAPFLWHEVNGHDRVTVVLRNGRVAKLANDAYGFGLTFMPMPAAVSPGWLLPAVEFALAAFLLTLLWWPAAAIIRHRYAAPLVLQGHQLGAYRCVSIIAFLPLAAAAAWMVQLSAISDGQAVSDLALRVTQALSLAAMIAGAGAAGYNLWATWCFPRRWGARLWSVVLAAAVLVLVWTTIAFRLVASGVDY